LEQTEKNIEDIKKYYKVFDTIFKDPKPFINKALDTTFFDELTNKQGEALKALEISAAIDEINAELVNKAFRKVALKHHPDKIDGNEEKVTATIQMQYIIDCRDLLLDFINNQSPAKDTRTPTASKQSTHTR
jgi:hypothetical protein